MADGGMLPPYPQVFVVDSQAPCMPMPMPMPTPLYPRRAGWRHRLLFALTGLALLGVLIEACCIYYLHKSHEDSSLAAKQQDSHKPEISNEIPTVTKKPDQQKKPAALLKGSSAPVSNDGVLLWTDQGLAFRQDIDYKDGRLTVKQKGYYFVYSKIALWESQCVTVNHQMMRSTVRYGDGKPMELMQSRRFHCPKKSDKAEINKTDVTNSYLGGAFHLYANDSVYVKLEGPAQIRIGQAENFFGAFML
ncbi:hypothetical protein ACEWY4_017428 [Coilia grayii]|uniref:THD domain-containing protein n=1 Tax=Coilia grayii TaxID=363190 RepID=A0ABD1JH34_9TELE